MKGYKAFDKGLICKGKQYKENETFEEERAVPCHIGMHFCKNPFDVLNFYDLVDENGEFLDFARVEAPDDAEVKTDDNIKYCTTKLKIGAKFSFAGFVKTCVDFVIEKTQSEKPDSGNYAQIGSSGDSAQIGSSGYSAKIGSSGDYAKIGSSGYYAKIGSSGYSAKIGSSGDSTQIGSSGCSAKIGSSGDSAKIGSSGDSAQIGSSGDSAKIGSSGDSAQIKSTGYDSIICCAGDDSCVSAKKGSWITLAEWKYSYEKDRYVPKCVKTEYVDGERIKEDTMYKLIDGEFTEV
nr:MAG TPA: hypothetical protein [Caudoviricetes sp.]